MEIIERHIEDIIPYENNPRKNDKAAEAVAESIKQCGYVAPIIVDENGIILAGHTRLKALKKLGATTAEVVVKSGLTEEQKKKYRILDNKTGELAEWDFPLLMEEVDGLDFDGFDFGLDNLHFWGEDNQETSEEYEEFVEKFEQKKTTDDCFTPSNIYDAVKNWAVKKYSLEGREIIRPFYPGGDYEHEKYPERCVVIDNPPFSILSDICRFYDAEGIDYFLFGPALMLFNTNSGMSNYVISGSGITYENGARVSTGFVTNMGEYKVETAPDLYEAIEAEDKKNREEQTADLPQYKYPDEVITPALLKKLAKYGQNFKVKREEAHFIRALESQKEEGKAAYGAGFLISEKAAAEKAAAEKAAAEKAAAEKAAAEKAAAEKAAAEKTDAIEWELSEREKEIVKALGK